MATHHDDIELTIGDTWTIVGLLLDEEGQPMDLTAGVTFGWALINWDGVPVVGPVATIEPQDDGIVHITVPDSFTRTLEPARYLDAIRVWVDDVPMTQWIGNINANADPFFSEVAT